LFYKSNIIKQKKFELNSIPNLGGITKLIAPYVLSEALEIASLTAIQELEQGFQQLVKDGVINDTEVPIEETTAKVLKTYNKQATNSLNMVNTVMKYKAKTLLLY
jgi:hypothetical protein